MNLKVALVGNPNCGKTTIFNRLTGSNQYVGNWPGVTVEKKEGFLKGDKNVKVVDLPGIYSLTPYTSEEIVSRKFLFEEKPDLILNVVSCVNIERNLFLTLQLLETNIPVIIIFSMMDKVKKGREFLNLEKITNRLGCEFVENSAKCMSDRLIFLIRIRSKLKDNLKYSSSIEKYIDRVEEILVRYGNKDEKNFRFDAIRILEKDFDFKKNMKFF